MSFIDDFFNGLKNTSDTVKQYDATAQEAVGTDIYSFLSKQAKDQIVKLVPQLGNLSEQQLKDGQRGQAPGIPTAKTPMAQIQNAIQASGISVNNQKYLMWGVLGLGGLFAISMISKKKRRRG